jgi:hypothetical protein
MKEPKKSKRSRSIPSWLRTMFRSTRYLIIPVLCLAAIVVGLYIGYSVVGDGEGADVWKLETWKHLIDLVFAD